MTKTVWWDRLAEARDFLMFWGPVPDETKAGTERAEWERETRESLGRRDNATLDDFASRCQARYDETEATRSTITTRANSLLLFVGVLTTGGSLIAQSLAKAPGPLVIGLVVLGVLLLYAAVAAVVLAVRAQLVGHWDTPRIDVEAAVGERSVKLTYAVEIYIAAEQNRARLRRPVSFLRDGQYYAIAGTVLVALLASLSVAAALVR